MTEQIANPLEEARKRLAVALGDELRKARMATKLTQGDVALHLRLSQQSVAQWESGECSPRYGHLAALLRLFRQHGVDVSFEAFGLDAARQVNPLSEAFMVGQAVRRIRQQWGWSQQELSRRCGWGNQSRISQYEAGANEPSLRDIKTLALTLSVPPELLLAEAFRAPLIEEPSSLSRSDDA